MTEHNERNNATKKTIFRWDDIDELDILPPEQPETDDDIEAMRALQSDPQQALFEKLMQAELATL